MKPSMLGIMIAIVLVSLIAGGYAIYMSDMANSYGVTTDNSSLAQFNRMTEIAGNVEEMKQNLTNLNAKPSVSDALGTIFSNAWSVLVGIPKSLSILTDWMDIALSNMGIDKGAELIKAAAITILSILIFGGVVLVVLLRTDWI